MTPNAQHKRAADWQAGDFLKMGDRTYEFIDFEPAYPRAKARDHFGSIAFIDVSRQQAPRTNAEHKRAERERRVARGDKRIEVWLEASDANTLREMASDANVSTSEVVKQLIRYYHS